MDNKRQVWNKRNEAFGPQRDSLGTKKDGLNATNDTWDPANEGHMSCSSLAPRTEALILNIGIWARQ